MPSVRPMSSREFSQYSVGADAYIGPLGSYEFAADSHKNRCVLRADRAVSPYKRCPVFCPTTVTAAPYSTEASCSESGYIRL